MEESKKSKIPLIIAGVIALAVVLVFGIMAISNTPSKRFREQMGLGDRYLEDRNYEQAIAAYEVALAIDPKNETALEQMASAYMAWADQKIAAGDIDGAIVLLQEGLMKAGNAALAERLNRLKDQAGEVQVRQEPGPETPVVTEPDPYAEYESLLQTDNYDEAMAYYEKQLIEDPKNDKVYCFGAAICLKQDDAVGALTILEEGIASGADRDILAKAEEYIRANTVPVAVYETEKMEQFEGEEPEPDITVSSFYDENGRIIRRESTEGTLTVWEYDSEGRTTYYHYRYNMGEDENYYEYNEEGDIIHRKSNDIYNGRSSEYESWFEYEYEYDAKNQLIHKTTKGTSYSTDEYYEYDENGNMVHSRSVRDGDVYEVFNEYDGEGRIIHYQDTGAQGTAGSYQYDERGNKIVAKEWAYTITSVFDLMNLPVESKFDGVYLSHSTYVNVYHFKGDLQNVLRSDG